MRLETCDSRLRALDSSLDHLYRATGGLDLLNRSEREGMCLHRERPIDIALTNRDPSRTREPVRRRHGRFLSIAVQDSELVAEGAELYRASRADCHGGESRGTDDLSQIYAPNQHAYITFLLAAQRGSRATTGTSAIWPVDGLTSEDVDAIVAFVRETQRIEGFEPFPP